MLCAISAWCTDALVSLGQLIKILGEAQMAYVVDQLIMFLSGKDDELRDISGLGAPPSHPSSHLHPN